MKTNEKKKRVEVEIYGEKYIVKGDAADEHILQVADYVDIKMNMIAQRNPHLSGKQLAVLAALNIADELYRLQDDYDKMLQILEEVKKD
jgi:cell division protein ZapA